MEKFLKKYYKQLHFNSMPSGVRKQFDEWLRNGTLTDDMRLWVRDYMHFDTTTNKYVQNTIPDPNSNADLPDKDARELFIAFQNAFAGMSANINSFKDKEPESRDFVNKYYGAGKLFSVSHAKPECETGIREIINLMKSDPQVKRIVLNSERGGKKLFENETKLDEFIKKCENKKYNSDASVQGKIQTVASVLENAAWSYSGTNVGNAIENIHSSLNDVMDPGAFAMDPASIDATKLADFRGIYAKNPEGLLQTLYKNKTIRDRFANYDNGKITGPINKAEKEVNYQDTKSENYVDEKISDKLTPLERLEKQISDTYSDTIKKYEELRGGNMFFKQEAKDIFAAIDKVKIKPSSGLKTLLDKKSDVEGKIKNPVARQHFKWFYETMEPIAKKMPKAVEGAWSRADKMQAIVEQIIIKATDPKNTDPHAIEKAKTAMEIMTAMKYGMLTSKVMEAMKQTEFKVFSDGGLSWNKNEGIQFVTKAFDKSVKAAFMGAGFAITVVRNKIMLSGGKFKNKDNQNGVLKNRFDAEHQRVIDETNLLNQDKRQEQAERRTHLSQMRALNASDGINGRTIRGKERDVRNYKQTMDNNKTAHDEYENAETIIAQRATKQTEVDNLRVARDNLQTQLTDLENQFNDPATYAGMPPAAANAHAQQLQQQILQMRHNLNNAQNSFHNAEIEFNSWLLPTGEYGLAQRIHADATKLAAYDAYNDAKTNYDDLNQKVQIFKEAKQNAQESLQHMRDIDAALATMSEPQANKVVDLENYWNFLQNGNTRTWMLSLKRAQGRFDRNKNVLLRDFYQQYSLAG